VARDKEKLIADIIESDYDTEEKTLRILSIDAEKRNRTKSCFQTTLFLYFSSFFTFRHDQLSEFFRTADKITGYGIIMNDMWKQDLDR